MTIDKFFNKYKSATEIDGVKIEYICKQAFTEAVAELISQPLKAEVMQKIADIVDKYGLDCPQCPNTGCYGESISRYEYDDNGLPTSCYEDVEAVQCEFCYTEPRSKFNLENELKEKFASNFMA